MQGIGLRSKRSKSLNEQLIKDGHCKYHSPNWLKQYAATLGKITPLQKTLKVKHRVLKLKLLEIQTSGKKEKR